MAESTLLITPTDSQSAPRDLAALLDRLREQGLIGTALDQQRYALGESYPRLLSFMGCSPYFKTEPEHPDDLDYCHLELRGPWPEPRLLGRLEDAAPRCPQCRKPDRHWSDHTPAPQPQADWTCPHCGQQQAWGQLNWRGRAGFARFALVFHHIFEAEAVPGPALLETLQASTDSDWNWFYG